MANYEIWLRRDDGTPLMLIERILGLRYAHLMNDVSACQITLPGDFAQSFLTVDRRLDVWRRPAGGSLQREGIWFIRKIRDYTLDNGMRKIEVTGFSPNTLLDSRIIAYAADSAQAKQEDYMDDMQKVVVTQNLSTGATAARQLTSTYFSIAPELGAAPSKEVSFPWRNLLNVLKDIAEASKGAGTNLYLDTVPISNSKFEFRTYTGQPGIDHTFPSGKPPVILGLEYGNLAEPSVEWDYSEEATYIYAAGQGEGASRTVVEVEDTARSGRSVFGRRERFVDARQASSTGEVQAIAERALAEGKPRLRFTGRILDAPGTRYGVHWRHGDRVSAIYYGQQYDCLVRSIEVFVDGSGGETINTRLEAEE